MLESKDHWQIQVSSGVLDLTLALRIPGYGVANVKSTPLAFTMWPGLSCLPDKVKAKLGLT
jgi:hypothetical protein